MSSRGVAETERLRQNLTDQLDRLMAQLQDLEDCREDLDPDEYLETRRDTVDQLKEFQLKLKRFAEGDISLVDQFSATQLAIQAAITEAFRTPEVIRMFAKRQPQQLREKLTQLGRDKKLGKLPEETHTQQQLEILLALRKLGETLTEEELEFISANSTDDIRQLMLDDENMTFGGEEKLTLSSAHPGTT